jgi:hypothetical protein
VQDLWTEVAAVQFPANDRRRQDGTTAARTRPISSRSDAHDRRCGPPPTDRAGARAAGPRVADRPGAKPGSADPAARETVPGLRHSHHRSADPARSGARTRPVTSAPGRHPGHHGVAGPRRRTGRACSAIRPRNGPPAAPSAPPWRSGDCATKRRSWPNRPTSTRWARFTAASSSRAT